MNTTKNSNVQVGLGNASNNNINLTGKQKLYKIVNMFKEQGINVSIVSRPSNI